MIRSDFVKRLRKTILPAIIIILALPMFAWLSWDPTTWLRMQMESSGTSSYVQVEKVETSGLGLLVNSMRIQIPDRSDISLNEVSLSPAWSRMIRGVPALHVQGSIGKSSAFSFNISIWDDVISLSEVHLRGGSETIKDYLPQAAVLNLSGDILISGEIKLRQSDALPLTGKVTIQWQKAASGLTGQGSLGDYQFHLASSKKREWLWKVEGGEMLLLNGNGHLSTVLESLSRWQMDGNIHVQSRGQAASLLSWMTGHDRGVLTLSGNVSSLQVEFLKP